MSGTTSLSNALSLKNTAADSHQESAATSIATTGQPPASHERATRSIARCAFARSTSANRMARYKDNPARRAARSVRGAPCERHATIDTLRTAGVPLCPRRLDARLASLPARAVHSRPGPQQRVNDIAQERTAPPIVRRCLMPALEWDFKSSRASTYALHGRRLSASTPGTSVPLAWLLKGATCDVALREPIWRLDSPTVTRSRVSRYSWELRSAVLSS